MADSYHLRDGVVIPYSGGRMNLDVDSHRDATDLELSQQEEIEELYAEIDRLTCLLNHN